MEQVENFLKMPLNILVCFTDIETGKAMSKMVSNFAISRSEKTSIIFLHLVDNDEDLDQNKLDNILQDISLDTVIDKNKITLRSFVKKNEDFLTEILNTSKEHNINLLLIGLNSNNFTPQLFRRYFSLKGDPTNSDSYIMEQFTAEESQLLNKVSALFDMNPITTGLFINKGLSSIEKVFVPILSASDTKTIPFATIRFSQKDDVELMIWDAIGAIESNPKMQKLYMSYLKKTDDKVYIWDDNKKIEKEYIMQQNLCIIGMEGWNRLISTTLPWIDVLPSTLIIKDKTT